MLAICLTSPYIEVMTTHTSWQETLTSNWLKCGSRMYMSLCGQLTINLIHDEIWLWEIRDINQHEWFERFDERHITIALQVANDLIADNNTVFPF